MFGLNKQRAAKGGAAAIVVALALPVTAHFEGLRTRAYLDPVGIPTICYGETIGVEIGQVKSKEECDKMLSSRLGWFSYQVDKAVIVDMNPKTHAALTSFAYNVGIGAFERSTLLKKLNAKDYEGACNELPKWKYAGGKVWAGLVKRRDAERKLCLEGVYDVSNT